MTTVKKFPEGLLGRKLGMTQVFDEDGRVVPVTMIEMGPCTILDIISEEKNGYEAVRLGFAPKKAHRCNRAEQGQFNKAGKGAFSFVREMRCAAGTLGWTNLGQELTAADVFDADELVDVTGTSIGRGFSGVFRRHNMKGQPNSRGTHEVRRHIGAVSQGTTPGRIFAGKRMPGQMGNARTTMQNLKVVAVRPEESIILVKGNVPGPKGAFVEVRKAIQSYQGPVARINASAESAADSTEGATE